MRTENNIFASSTVQVANDAVWDVLYPSLQSFVRALVFSFRVPLWQGQEHDVAEDIVQEVMLRLIKYTQKAERGEAIPIHSLERFMRVIASNCCKDRRRRDRRLVRLSSDEDSSEIILDVESQVDPSERAIEQTYQAWLFTQIAHEVAHFPDKQREALLIDLAQRMHFGTQATSLQTAFLKAGIDIQAYHYPLPEDDRERKRHTTLLSYAYKRLAHVLRTQVLTTAS